MIALSVSMTLAPEDFAEVREFTASLAELNRKDAGCVEYWWAEPLETSNTLRLFEVWESMEAIQDHLAQSHELKWKSEYQPLVRDIGVVRYDPTTKDSVTHSLPDPYPGGRRSGPCRASWKVGGNCHG
ncbi:putative quinol monooxygenase [Rhodococcus sp. NPDC003318]|uniref:putative quinol monooxygenase n=1 Tax=Rhodococcus sp. NPDC003318 TaxID=3364503 RepID=UPI0036ACE4C9